MNPSVLTISMCYNRPEIILRSIQQYYKTKHPSVNTEHVLVDAHWPLERERMLGVFQFLKDSYGCRVIDPGKNLGLCGNFNYALEQVPFPDNGGVIGYDPDSWPIDFGWDMAMCEKFEKHPDVAWISLFHPQAKSELIDQKRGTEDGDIVWVNGPVMNSVCMFRKGWLRKCGGLLEMQPFYGGLEVHTWRRLREQQAKWIFLKNYREGHWPYPELVDKQYQQWKWVTNHGGEKQTDFAEWIKSR